MDGDQWVFTNIDLPFLLSARSRDVALRAVALSSKRSYDLWYRSLLQTISFQPEDVSNLAGMVERKPQLGTEISSLLQVGTTGEESLDLLALITKFLPQQDLKPQSSGSKGIYSCIQLHREH